MDDVRKGTLYDPELMKVSLYNNGEVAFINNLKDLENTMLTNLAVQMEMYVIILLLEGKATVDLNGTAHVLYKNDLLVCTPNIIVENMLTSIDFKCNCVCISPAYMQKISPMSQNAWDVKILFEKKPIYTLKPEEVIVFCQYYNLLCSKIHLPSPVQTKVIDTLMLAFIYDMQYVLNRMISAPTHSFTSGEQLFRQFIKLLEDSYPKSRRVDYYAEKLHVTPKYLSTVCKSSSGPPPSKLINIYVLRDIEYLLKHTMKNVKEIAYQLDFPNLSFFGKYVKQHFGMSPKAYREHAMKEKNNIPQYNTINNDNNIKNNQNLHS